MSSINNTEIRPPQPVKMYNAKCSDCGKETQVAFKPKGKDPVYCQDCFKRRNSNRTNYRNIN